MPARKHVPGRAFCPGCGQKYAVPEDELKQRPGMRFSATCRQCGTAFSVRWIDDGLETEKDKIQRGAEDDGRNVLPKGKRVGKYEIEEILASGGSSSVYRAFEMGANRTVALKVLHRPPDSDYGVRFRREVEVQGNLKHPNLMPIFDQGTVDGMPYYTMELLHKPTSLETIVGLFRTKRLAYNPSLRGFDSLAAMLRLILIPVARAIHFANQNGIVHRDLKPGNVIVDARTRHVYVIDFGICRLYRKPGQRLVLRAGGDRDLEEDPKSITMGTVRFMPPEQAHGESSEQGDIWALGALLHYILSGESPIAPAIDMRRVGLEKRVANLRKIAASSREAGDEDEARFYERRIAELGSETLRTPKDVLKDAQEANYVSLPDGTEPALAAIAARAMAAAPADRYPTAEHLAYDLERWLAGRPVRAYVASLGAGKGSLYKARLYAQRNRNPLIAGGVVLVLAVIVLIALDVSSKSEQEDQIEAWLGEARTSTDFAVQEDRLTKVLVLRPDHVEAKELLALARKFEPLKARVAEARGLRDEVRDILDPKSKLTEGQRYAKVSRLERKLADTAAILEGSVIRELRSLPKDYFGRRMADEAVAIADYLRGRRNVTCSSVPRGVEITPIHPRSGEDLALQWDSSQPWGVAPLLIKSRPLSPGSYTMRFLRTSSDKAIFVPFVINHLSPAVLEVRCPFDPAKLPAGMLFVGGRQKMRFGDLRFTETTRLVAVRPFLIDAYEVTNAEYAAYVNALPADRRELAVPRRLLPGPGDRTAPLWTEKEDGTWSCPEGSGDHPVTGVSYLDAVAYARVAGKRLPTPQEWELAARGMDGRDYPFGNQLELDACNAQTGTVARVGSFPRDRSPYGAFDMGGNVAEWTEGGGGGSALVKGGSFDLPRYRVIATAFGKRRADLPYGDVGFRCARSLK